MMIPVHSDRVHLIKGNRKIIQFYCFPVGQAFYFILRNQSLSSATSSTHQCVYIPRMARKPSNDVAGHVEFGRIVHHPITIRTTERDGGKLI